MTNTQGNRGWAAATVAAMLMALVAAIPSRGQTFENLVNFDVNNGYGPAYVSIIQGTDGGLYGTTAWGGIPDMGCGFGHGAAGCGTAFKVSPAGRFTEVYRFDGSDGTFPYAGLIEGSDGNFYGTTSNGGNSSGHECGFDCGTVFRMTPAGVIKILHSFMGKDGGYPQDSLLEASDGNFYGTTSQGGGSPGCGTGGCGTVFRITPDGEFTTLHVFRGSDGGNPYAALIQGSDGDLYGTTPRLGPSGYGTVFKMTLGGVLTLLHSFNGRDGGEPSSLTLGRDGNFYGTTMTGGSGRCAGGASCGTVFKMTPQSTVTTLHSFADVDGSAPVAGVIQATDGNFYGTTTSGGASALGTAFSVSPSGRFISLHSFDSTDGASPYGGLFQATNGSFYGVTSYGGTDSSCLTDYIVGCGTVYSLSVGLGPFVRTQPGSGPPGTAIRMLGTDLTSATSVTFNGTPAAFTVVSGTEISITVPAGATTGPVQVTLPTGTLITNVNFRVLP